MKICWITNIPSPYKVRLFGLLSQKIELFVVYEKVIEKDREQEWLDYSSASYPVYYLDKDFSSKSRKLADTCDLLVTGDFTNTSSMKLTRAFKKAHKPTVLQADGGLAIPRSFFDLVIRAVMNQYDAFLSSGAETDKYFKYYGMKQELIHHFRFTSLTEEDMHEHAQMILKKEEFKKKLNMTEDFIFLSVGQQIPRKGYDVLVEAASKLHGSVGFYILGGKPKDKVSKLIEADHLTFFHFPGFKSNEELSEYYAAADVFVLPTRYDIWGLVINEAASFGLPIISTDRCVAALEFRNMNAGCTIVPSESVDDLAKSMQQLLDDPAQVQAMSIANLEVSKTYTMENSALDIIEDLKQIMDKEGKQ